MKIFINCDEEIIMIIKESFKIHRKLENRFIAKAYEEPYVNYAVKIILGNKKVSDFKMNPYKNGYSIKEPVFSFDKFPNVNKELGPEMKSTGESIYFIDDLMDDYFLDIYSKRNLYLSK